MEFDKSRIFTTVNADELRVGDLVLLANTLTVLKEMIAEHYTPSKLVAIKSEDCLERFCDDDEDSFCLAYLVKRTEMSLDKLIAEHISQ